LVAELNVTGAVGAGQMGVKFSFGGLEVGTGFEIVTTMAKSPLYEDQELMNSLAR
jgi:hypothetical protein